MKFEVPESYSFIGLDFPPFPWFQEPGQDSEFLGKIKHFCKGA